MNLLHLCFLEENMKEFPEDLFPLHVHALALAKAGAKVIVTDLPSRRSDLAKTMKELRRIGTRSMSLLQD